MRYLALVLALALLGPVSAYAIGPCREISEITEASGVTSLSDRPAVFCGAQFIADAAGGSCHIYDSPDASDPSHGQVRNLTELSAATALDTSDAWFGNPGYPTRFGLGVEVDRGRCYVLWGS